MLFDEFYTESLYRNESVMTSLQKADTLLVIGTAFYTTLSSRIVNHAIQAGLKIVEVNKRLEMEEMPGRKDFIQVNGCAAEIIPFIA
jgi:NAD-dependent SIR2 family protein deacetylase